MIPGSQVPTSWAWVIERPQVRLCGFSWGIHHWKIKSDFWEVFFHIGNRSLPVCPLRNHDCPLWSTSLGKSEGVFHSDLI